MTPEQFWSLFKWAGLAVVPLGIAGLVVTGIDAFAAVLSPSGWVGGGLWRALSKMWLAAAGLFIAWCGALIIRGLLA